MVRNISHQNEIARHSIYLLYQDDHLYLSATQFEKLTMIMRYNHNVDYW